MKYLTVEQALADVPYFADKINHFNFTTQDLSPNVTPWVFIGGSYSGSRAAWIRKTYPDTIYAAFSSSADLQARVDMSSYNDVVQQALVAFGYENCTRDVKAALDRMDSLMEDPQDAVELKRSFNISTNQSNAGFARSLSWVIPGKFQYYGPTDPGDGTGLGSFCDWISTDPDSGQTSQSEGWAESKGADFTVQRWATWPSTSSLICQSCDIDISYGEPSEISWLWQTCTQLGKCL